jgi:hypothetical protein
MSAPRKLRIGSPHQFYAGLLFTGIGTFALVVGTNYPIGTTTRVGPGYFPLLLSVILIGLGIAAIVRSLIVEPMGSLGSWPLVPLFCVLAGVVGFGLLIDHAGLIPAALCVLLMSTYRRWLRSPIEVLVITIVLLGFVVVLFIDLLGMPMQLF